MKFPEDGEYADLPEVLCGKIRRSPDRFHKTAIRSDVPVGAYLSGGLDSSITTALIKKIYKFALKDLFSCF